MARILTFTAYTFPYKNKDLSHAIGLLFDDDLKNKNKKIYIKDQTLLMDINFKNV